MDEAGNESDPLTVTVPEDSEVPGEDGTPPTIGDVGITGNTSDGYRVSGTASEPGEVNIYDSDGEHIGTSQVGADSEFSLDISSDAIPWRHFNGYSSG